MNRRTFLGSVGALGSIAAIGLAGRDEEDTLSVRFWRSERAAGYPNVAERVREYLRFALDLPYWSLEVTDGGVVAVSTEDGARVTTRGEWPANLLAGRFRREGVEPADVNLLVTDGSMSTAPTGYGLPRVASVGGARHLAELAPIEEEAETVPLTRSNFVAQVLLHEAGHALGLRHDHGAAFRRGDSIVVTPMLSAYAWDPSFEHATSRCGLTYPDLASADAGLSRRLTFSFSDCARRRLAEWHGGIDARDVFRRG